MLKKVLLGLSLVATALCVLLAYLAYAALSLIVELSDSYIRFSLSGVHTMDTQLQRDGHANVRLVGMMHFGATESYESLYRSFAKPSSLILEEGISDAKRPARTSYRCATETTINSARNVMEQPSLCIIKGAHRVGHVSQARGTSSIDIVNADVNLQDMSLQTQEWIERNLGLLKKLTEGDFDNLEWGLIIQQFSSSIPKEVWDDILYARNDHVIETFKQAADHYDHVVIPWGAMHGPGIQQALLDLGYTANEHQYHLVLPWRALLEL
ncbi:MAG: hypothetical protein AB8B48_10260 [Pseudomonadales bacterium]